MTEQRRYREEEIRQIFQAATENGDVAEREGPSPGGLTLQDLQEIGREVGIPVERIAEAASALDDGRVVSVRREYLSIPISVARVIDLPRAPTEREWSVLVTELRETFAASGRVHSHGELRAWTNGNLHAYMEPTQAGYRLRMGTRKGSAIAMTTAGVVGIALGAIDIAGHFLAGDLAQSLGPPLLLVAVGAACLVAALLRLPAWAQEREEQMEYIGERVKRLLGPAA